MFMKINQKSSSKIKKNKRIFLETELSPRVTINRYIKKHKKKILNKKYLYHNELTICIRFR